MGGRRIAMTGPCAAALHRLDGFRGHDWPTRFVAPATGKGAADIIRTRRWFEPIEIDGLLVAPVRTVLRHLDCGPWSRPGDEMSELDRAELAVEHALRMQWATPADIRCRGGRTAGDELLRGVRDLRGDEPATESYAETRAVQLFRSFGWRPWRQLPVMQFGRIVHRVDFVLPFVDRARRPAMLRPTHGLLIEIDSEEHHEARFHEDHERQATYDALGYHWVTVTPRQIESRPDLVCESIEGALGRASPKTSRGQRPPIVSRR